MNASCSEDTTKSVGDSWQCDNPKCVCTCLDNGHVSADCPPAPGAQNVVTATSSVEEVLVKGAFVVVLLFMMCFTALCFFMFRANKGRRSRKEVLQEVDDIQEEEREGP